MNITCFKKLITTTCFFFLIWTFPAADVSAQSQRAQLSLDLQLEESLTRSQVINITNIFTGRGRGASLFTLLIQNENTSQPARDLYFNIRFRSEKGGLLAHTYQKQGQPFSLQPGQQVFVTSRSLSSGLPGVEESIRFDGGLTGAGVQFFNRLDGSTKLPPDRYRVQIDVFQGGNSRSGGIWLTSTEAELGVELAEDVRDIFLTSPGNVMGSDAEITNPYPDFRWEGNPGTDYRLVVVEARGQDSPESLLQGALSTASVRGENRNRGILLDYEILDVRLNRTNYQFPPSGVRALESGKRYYWQVQAELAGSNGMEVRTSEIWSFTLASPDRQRSYQMDGELSLILQRFLGDSQYRQLQQNGFRLESMIIDGEVISGPSALQKLVDLNDMLDQDEISIVVDN